MIRELGITGEEVEGEGVRRREGGGREGRGEVEVPGGRVRGGRGEGDAAGRGM